MNAKQLRQGSQNVQRASKQGEWWLIVGLLLASALVLVVAGHGAPGQMASRPPEQPVPAALTPVVMNNHLYVPCSVGPCDPSRTTSTLTPVVMNNHLYVPCSVAACDPPQAVPATLTPDVMNNHLYVPCSVGPCDRTH